MTFYEIDGVVPIVAPDAYVHPSATVIGDVSIGAGCYIGPSASLRGDFGRIVVGACSNVQDTCVVHAFPGADAVLAEFSHIGHGVVLHGCTIGSRALIGMNAVVMDGAVIGAGSLVGACSFVRAGTQVPPNSLAVGNPAVVKPLDPKMRDWMRAGQDVYAELARRSLAGLHEVEPLRTEPSPRPRVGAYAEQSKPWHETR